MESATLGGNDILLTTAIAAFGERGLEGASTRDIARAAGKPMSAITYHFGSKDGLYLACAGHIAATMHQIMAPALAPVAPDGKDPVAAARAGLRLIFETFVNAMVRPETASFARFVSREQMEPTAAFSILYDGVMGAVKARIEAHLVCVSGSRIDAVEASVRTIALIGQVLAFRLARATVLRSTGWTEIGVAEAARIHAVVQSQLAAVLDSLERGNEA